MLNIGLLPRPWSCHAARVEGYWPLITCKIERVSRSKRNAWRASVLVDGVTTAFSHHDTKAAAESKAEGWMRAETEVHYRSRTWEEREAQAKSA